MPYLYVYSPSDFVGGIPAESGAQAAGSPTFTLTLVPGAQPTVIEVTDNDAVFDEIDGSQVVTTTVTIDGVTIPAGTSINTAYDLINTANGHKVTSFHFGGDGYQQGAVDGLVSTVALQPGQSYSFNTERTSHQQNNQYDDYVACFTPGTRITTPDGPRVIDTLCTGDLVQTLDNGAQPILWIGKTEVAAEGRFAPIRVAPGVLGNRRTLLLSPEHRVLLRGAQVQLLFGDEEALVAVKSLVNGCDITREEGGRITYLHLLLPRHEIVFAEGAMTESLLPCETAFRGAAEHAKDFAEARLLFDEETDAIRAARRCLRSYEGLLLRAAA